MGLGAERMVSTDFAEGLDPIRPPIGIRNRVVLEPLYARREMGFVPVDPQGVRSPYRDSVVKLNVLI